MMTYQTLSKFTTMSHMSEAIYTSLIEISSHSYDRVLLKSLLSLIFEWHEKMKQTYQLSRYSSEDIIDIIRKRKADQ
jgi:hypothetical protein